MGTPKVSARCWTLVTAVPLVLGACGARGQPAAATAQAVLPARAPRPTPTVDVSIIDRHVDPCVDFYRYACGGWLDATTIPPDRPAWSRSFSEIEERTLGELRGILDSYATGAPAGDDEARKLGDFYGTCMDETKAETASRATLAEHLRPLEALSAWSSIAARPGRPVFARLIAELHLAGVNALFDFGEQQDFENAGEVIAAADQGGLGLPDRDYYLRGDEATVAIRRAYGVHVARMFELDGVAAAEARARAESVLDVETVLARGSMPRREHRDPTRVHHRLDRARLDALTPAFDWGAYLQVLGHSGIAAVNVLTPDFFAALDRALEATPPAALESYLEWHLLDSAAPALGRAFVQEQFRFAAENFTGQAALLPRWKRCVAAVAAGMGQALGKPFVAANFTPIAKTRAEGLVASVEGTFRSRIEGLRWMDAPTRAQALEKLGRVYNQIGYPARWRDYSALEIGRKSDLANRFDAAAVELERELGKIGQPVDRSDWEMSPQAVNAYYDPSKNEMVFPAGILQPPFFDVRASPEVDDGGIGVVMGHELTHGFDDQGRKFDAQGNLRDWWTPEVGRAFEQRVACVVGQYDAYAVLGDLHVDGRLTAGENIADIGGLRLAHAVFRATASAAATQGADGLTDEQRFFVAFGQAWCAKRRDAYARLAATVDVHSPPRYRVNGPVSDLPAFQDAFSCKDGAPMAPRRRCEVW
ncbi:MAG TPA: M13 family metallopeptidase [Polyangia bacterium]|nr:M13 family metallopeptidase [Polyangia bacterium]